ncbi:MAG: endonuclease domain-containing protein [Erythrobacter sp.]
MITGPRETLKRARKLRSEMTLPEVVLWRELRRRPGGFKFRRQHPAGAYVLNFYCAAACLAIEVDGFAHDSVPVVNKDRRRSEWLRSQGVATTRIPARLVLNELDAVVVRIADICRERVMKCGANLQVPLHHPADGPPPPAGEEG